jgi:uncharacterized protein YndB with AHSA1/START domain
MTTTSKVAPVRKSARVGVPPQRAFDVFVNGMHTWWPLAHTLLKSPRQAVVVEPRPDGRWYERAIDGSECSWGKVLAWEPPTRILLGWQLDAAFTFNPDLVTEVEVRFSRDGVDGTRVELEHRNLERYGEQAEHVRAALDSPDGWDLGLREFVNRIPYAAR